MTMRIACLFAVVAAASAAEARDATLPPATAGTKPAVSLASPTLATGRVEASLQATAKEKVDTKFAVTSLKANTKEVEGKPAASSAKPTNKVEAKAAFSPEAAIADVEAKARAASFKPAAKAEAKAVLAKARPAAKADTKPVVATVEAKPAGTSPKPAANVEMKPVAVSVKPVVKSDTKPAVAKVEIKPAAASPQQAAKVEAAKTVSKATAKPAVAKVETAPVAVVPTPTPKVVAKHDANAKTAATLESKPSVTNVETAASAKPAAKVEAEQVAASVKLAAKAETAASPKPAAVSVDTTPVVVSPKPMAKTKSVASTPSVRGVAVRDVPHAAAAVAVSHEQGNKTIHEHAQAAQQSAEEAQHHLKVAKAAYAKTKANVDETVKTGKKIEGTAGDIKTLYTPPESGARLSAMPALFGLLFAIVVGNAIRISC